MEDHVETYEDADVAVEYISREWTDGYGVQGDIICGSTETDSETVGKIAVSKKMRDAGVPIEAVEDVVDFEDIPAEMAAGGKEFIGLRVQGSSMYPNNFPRQND